MNKETRKAMRQVIEAFWEYESGWGAPAKDKRAACVAQQWLGYRTKWDKARLAMVERDSK